MLGAQLLDHGYELANFVFEAIDGVELDAGAAAVLAISICSRVRALAQRRAVRAGERRDDRVHGALDLGFGQRAIRVRGTSGAATDCTDPRARPCP